MKTQGVRRYCVLNDLEYFHMFQNPTVDIMHDLNEGVIPFLMKHLFALCLSSKILTEGSLKQKMQYFDFGVCNRGKTPSVINLGKRNLNQNASQSKCLFQHLPFILFREHQHDKLKEVWKCVESLLIITPIAYSRKITETDLELLQENVHIHLDSIQKKFNVDLLTKHHNLTHYANVIRKMGPLVTLSMMRYESKHKTLKEIADQTRNFININKTLATVHQQMLTTHIDSYSDNFTNGKVTNTKVEELHDVIGMNNYLLNLPLINRFTKDNMLMEVKWYRFNDWIYRKGLLVLEHKRICEINKMFINDVDCLLIVKDFVPISYHANLNSLKFEEIIPSSYRVLTFANLENKMVYQKKTIDAKYYLMIDSLDTKNCIDITFQQN